MDAIWEPSQYLKFADARMQPALDLLARIALSRPRRVIDLGCGAGNVTRLLQQRWPGAAISGIDNSASMLAQGVRDAPDIAWVRQELASWQPDGAADLIFSNAALHWLPRHDELLPRLVSFLAPHGVLAIQMPRNFSAPSHMLIAETVRAGRWRDRLEPLLRHVPVESPAWYFTLLEPLVQEVSVWETEYLQVLKGSDPVKEWVKATWLKPLLDALEEPDRTDFEGDYARRLRIAYPASPAGVTLFPFKRLFLIARK
ncbi:MAG: methyltransferase domain-containing protein [Steroidobacterales bacterium]